MNRELPLHADDARPPDQERSSRCARRDFLARVAARAAYVAPAVIALSSSKGMAYLQPCQQQGSPCTADADCCGGLFCTDTMGDPVMQGGMGTCQP
ncbi:MAG: hypothetical protein JSV91_03005 [Phycisphaerales bacterium]|nr:MAG: hypothetical protein JSV91_03005 [Phycisphaerales bacterium]